jgi:glycine/D-amino acid oxidase-like deaminating enzyme
MELRIPVSPSSVEHVLAGYLRRADDDPRVFAIAQAQHALPIWRDFGGVIYLRPDGQLLGSGWDSPGVVEALTDNRPNRDMLHAARGYASKEFPSIEGLVPQRGRGAVPCHTCDGTGRIPGISDRNDNVRCSCGGLGWLPEAPAAP